MRRVPVSVSFRSEAVATRRDRTHCLGEREEAELAPSFVQTRQGRAGR